MILPAQSVWETLGPNPVVYVLFDKTLLFMESDDTNSVVRMFVNPSEAKEYRNRVVEEYNLRPSALTVGNISLSEIFTLREELMVLATVFFAKPLKIVLAEMVEDVIVSEEEVFNSEATIH